MIFVNDVGGVVGVPGWMKHVSPPDADGMTFVDVIFPAFLFIVGMSIPLSLGKLLQSGKSLLAVQGQILLRTLGLLTVGVFMVNEDSYSKAGLLPKPVWTLFVYLGIVLLWNRPSAAKSAAASARQRIFVWQRVLGGLLLLAMAFLYRGEGPRSWMELRPQWWGIIGLIGWGNLVASYVYLVAKNQLSGLIGAIALLCCLSLADSNGFLPKWWLFQYVDVASALASHPAIVVAGVVAGVVLSPQSMISSPRDRMRWLLIYGAGLALAGHLLHSLHALHPMFFINKIGATIPWGLWCSAITVWAWCLVYGIVDIRGWRRGVFLVAPAGENSLFAYILVPILYALFDLWELVFKSPLSYWSLSDHLTTGILRSFVLACAVVAITGGLRRVGIQPRI
jgi:heparan-alpha-glucosaminide N-acetyltransferase